MDQLSSCNWKLPYTGGILQRLVRHRCAQHCDSEKEHSAVTAMVRIVLLQC